MCIRDSLGAVLPAGRAFERRGARAGRAARGGARGPARMRVLLAALLLAQFASPAVARTAQKPEPVLEPGARVRVTLLARKDEPVVGTLLSLPAGSIEIEDS